MKAKKSATGAAKAAEGPVIHLDEPEVPGKGGVERAPKLVLGKEDPEDVRRRQEAFDGVHEWNGVELRPFSSSREALFGQLRLSMGAPPLGQCLADWDAFLGDALRILWLCTHGPEDWGVLRQTPLRLQAAIEEWGDVHVTGDKRQAASVVAMQVYVEAHRNVHEAAPAPRKGHGDDLGN